MPSSNEHDLEAGPTSAPPSDVQVEEETGGSGRLSDSANSTIDVNEDSSPCTVTQVDNATTVTDNNNSDRVNRTSSTRPRSSIEQIDDDDAGPDPPTALANDSEDDMTSPKRRLASMASAYSGLVPPSPMVVVGYVNGDDDDIHVRKKMAFNRNIEQSSKDDSTAHLDRDVQVGEGNMQNLRTASIPTMQSGLPLSQQGLGRRFNDSHNPDHIEFEEDRIQNLRTASFPRMQSGLSVSRQRGGVGRSLASNDYTNRGMRHIDNVSPSEQYTSNEHTIDEESGGGTIDLATLHSIPEAFLVEEDDGNNNRDSSTDIVLVDAKVIPPWYKQKRTKVFFAIIFGVVLVAAIAIGLSFSSDGSENATAITNQVEPLLQESTSNPSVSVVPTNEPTTESPSASLAPSYSPTSCSTKILTNGQKIELPLDKPSNVKIAVDGKNMVVVARDLDSEPDDGIILSTSVYVIFYTLSEKDMWERVNIFTEKTLWNNNYKEEDDDVLYSVAISGNTAMVGLPFGEISMGGRMQLGGVIIYEQSDNLGVWEMASGIGGDFGLSVDIDENLACSSSNDEVHIFHRDVVGNKKWVATDSLRLNSVFGCYVAGTTFGFHTVAQHSSFSDEVTYFSPRAVGFIEYLALHTYDETLGKVVNGPPMQGFYFPTTAPFRGFKDVMSVDLKEDRLVLLSGHRGIIGAPRDILIYRHQPDSSEQYTLTQNFTSPYYDDLAMDIDILLVQEQNQTIILTELADGNWEEALVLDGAFIDQKISNRELLATVYNDESEQEEVHYFSISDCIQDMPTQFPSFSNAPSAVASSSPSTYPTASPSATPSTTNSPTPLPSILPSAIPTVTVQPTQVPSVSAPPSETCYWIDVEFDYAWWCGPTWAITRILADDTNNIFMHESRLDWNAIVPGESKTICLPEGDYKFSTVLDPETATKSCCTGSSPGSFRVLLDGVAIEEGENCYNEIVTSFSLPVQT